MPLPHPHPCLYRPSKSPRLPFPITQPACQKPPGLAERSSSPPACRGGGAAFALARTAFSERAREKPLNGSPLFSPATLPQPNNQETPFARHHRPMNPHSHLPPLRLPLLSSHQRKSALPPQKEGRKEERFSLGKMRGFA